MENYVAGIPRSVLASPAEMQERLTKSLFLREKFNAGVFVMGIDGTAVASVPLSTNRVGVSFMERDFAVAALNEGKSTIGRPVMGRLLATPILVMAVPIRNTNGKIIGALAGVTDLAKPNFLGKVTERGYGKTGGYLLIASKHRLIVAASDKSRIMTYLPSQGVNAAIDRFNGGFEGFIVHTNPLGEEVLSSRKQISVANWAIVTTMPTAEAFAPIYYMQQRMAAATIIVSVIVSLLTWLMVRRQLSPLTSTAGTLRRISRKQEPMRALPVVGHDEISMVIAGFNDLITSLQESEALKRNVLNSVNSEIAVLARDGVIREVNIPWQQFAVENSLDPSRPAPHTGVGTNYLSRCERAEGASADGARDATMGIKAVLNGQLPAFSLDYDCHSPTEQRWFNMTVRPLVDTPLGGVVIAHTNVTARKLAEKDLADSENRFRTYIENTADALLVHDSSGRFIDVNRQACTSGL